MNNHIRQLYQLASKKTRTIIGLMSGTSVDGLDIALCHITNSGTDTHVQLSHFETLDYTPQFKENVASIFSKKRVDLEAVCLINEWIGKVHGQMILDFLNKRNIPAADIDLIASHGQTIYHAPKSLHKNNEFDNGTLQIGDGDHIAVTTGIITLSDFRQKHIAAGGEGAPLAVYGDYLIFGKKGENRIMLNIGGIANFTYLPDSMDMNEVFSTDVGPGNTMMDAYCKKQFQCNYDKDSLLAQKGTPNQALLTALLNHPFFEEAFPKTTGPELFNLEYLEKAQKESSTTDINAYDVLSTLNHFSAQAIVQSIQRTIHTKNNIVVYSSGGGMHNTLLMQTIQKALPEIDFKTTLDLHINPDAKEAVLFAILANETVAGNTTLQSTKKEIPNVTMGKISFPQ
jgi:anhydro-N-acetylmuramic acid kinase